jgi:ketosteroid isomerase-like protein
VRHASVEFLLRGYRAFVAGDLAAMEEMLDPDVEWVAAGEEAVLVNRDRVLEVLAERVAEGYHVAVDRAFGLSDCVVVSMRFSRMEVDSTDERPLQSRRSYLLGRWAGIVRMENERVVRVEEFPHLEAALEAAGIEGDGHA